MYNIKSTWHFKEELHCTPNQKLACFVLYLKIINTFLKNYIHASYSIYFFQKENNSG